MLVYSGKHLHYSFGYNKIANRMFGQNNEDLTKVNKYISKYIEKYPHITLFRDKFSLNFGACYRGFGRLSIGFDLCGKLIWPQDPFSSFGCKFEDISYEIYGEDDLDCIIENILKEMDNFSERAIDLDGKIIKTPIERCELFGKIIVSGGEYHLVSEEKT